MSEKPNIICPNCGSADVGPSAGNGRGDTLDCKVCYTHFTPGADQTLKLSNQRHQLWIAYFRGYVDGMKAEARFPDEIEEETVRWKAEIAFKKFLRYNFPKLFNV